jgi:hypothetical protein
MSKAENGATIRKVPPDTRFAHLLQCFCQIRDSHFAKSVLHMTSLGVFDSGTPGPCKCGGSFCLPGFQRVAENENCHTDIASPPAEQT